MGIILDNDISLYQIQNMEKAYYNEVMAFHNWEEALNKEIELIQEAVQKLKPNVQTILSQKGEL